MFRSRLLSIAAAAAFAMVPLAGAYAGPQEDADALFSDSKWAEAAGAYEALLDADSTSGANWFSLAQARHNLEDYAGARDAYLSALENGYQPAPRARLHLARAFMSLGDREAALAQLEEIAKTGGPTNRTLAGVTEFESLADAPRFQAVVAALTPCNTEEFRRFDFWLGEWDVAGAGGNTASSKISSRQDGCVVLEEYQAGAFTGMSINFYDATRKLWHQSWMSNAGGVVYLEGDLNEDGAMMLTDRNMPISEATGTINRVTWTPNDDGSVRQYWESSSDGGETWAVSFDGLYTAKKAE